jgi:hypothetical protein
MGHLNVREWLPFENKELGISSSYLLDELDYRKTTARLTSG